MLARKFLTIPTGSPPLLAPGVRCNDRGAPDRAGSGFFSRMRVLLVALVLSLMAPLAGASGGGSEEKPPEPMVFLVNIGKSIAESRILRVVMVLEYADSSAAHFFAGRRAKLMHHIFLSLSDYEASVLFTPKGKQDLREKIIREINTAFHETEKTGLKEVLFTDFIIQ